MNVWYTSIPKLEKISVEDITSNYEFLLPFPNGIS